MAGTLRTVTGRWLARLRTGAGAVVIGGASAVAGAALMVVSQEFGDSAPSALVALPAAALLALAVLSDPRIGVLGVFATFVIADREIQTGVALITLAELTSFAVAGLVILRRMGLRQIPLPWPPALWWALALLAWCLVSLPGAIDRAAAVKQIAQLSGGLLFGCVVIAAIRSMRDVRLILAGLVTAGVVVAINALIFGQQMRASFGGARVEGRLQGVFDQPNQLGAFCAVTAVVAAGLMFGARSRAARLASGGAIVVLVSGLLLSLSRGAWVGTALAVVVMVVKLPQARRAILVAAVPLLASALFLGSFQEENPQFDVVGSRVRSLTVLSPYDGRDDIWAEARRQIVERPITGFGPGSFPAASVRSASEAVTVRPFHAHNILLTWAAETGIPGAVIVTGFAVALWIVGRRASRTAQESGDTSNRAVIVGLQAALIALAGQGIVDYTLRNALIFIVFWAIAASLIASSGEAIED